MPDLNQFPELAFVPFTSEKNAAGVQLETSVCGLDGNIRSSTIPVDGKLIMLRGGAPSVLIRTISTTAKGDVDVTYAVLPGATLQAYLAPSPGKIPGFGNGQPSKPLTPGSGLSAEAHQEIMGRISSLEKFIGETEARAVCTARGAYSPQEKLPLLELLAADKRQRIA